MIRNLKSFALVMLIVPQLVFGQLVTNQVFYKLLETNESGSYTLEEGVLLGVEKGASGDVYIPYIEETETKSVVIGKFEVTSVTDYGANVEVSFLENINSESVLFAEFSIKPYNVYYNGITSRLAGKGIVFTNVYDEEIFNFQNREAGALDEYLIIIDFITSAKNVAKVLKESMDDIAITEGRYSGKTMFGVLENSTYSDVYSFLIYMNYNWELYFGNEWIFAEIYATWLTSANARNENSIINGKPSLGLSILRDFEYSNFPVIAELQPAYWYGLENENISPSTLITRVNDESMFNKTVEEVYAAFGTEENEIVNIEFFNNGVFETYNLPLLKIPVYKSSVTIEDLNMKSPNIYPVIKEDKWGLIDGNGDYVLNPKYDNIENLFFQFSNGLVKVELDKKVGFVNMLGEEIIAPQFTKCKSFSEGLSAIIEKEEHDYYSDEFLVGFIDVEGNRVSEMRYKLPSLYIGVYHGGMCQIDEYVDGTYNKGYLDRSGKLAIPMKFYSTNYFNDGYAVVKESEDSKYGIIDIKGNYVLQPSYDYINYFNEGEALAHINDHYWLIDRNGKKLLDFKNYRPSTFGGYTSEFFIVYTEDKNVGMMNRNGQIVIEPKYKTISGISKDLMSASLDTKRMDEGNWFFIDKNGEVIIPGPFQDVVFFSEDVCWVKKDDLWGLIDMKGNWLIEPVSAVRPSAFKGPLSEINIGDFMNPHFIYVNKEGSIVYNPKDE